MVALEFPGHGITDICILRGNDDIRRDTNVGVLLFQILGTTLDLWVVDDVQRKSDWLADLLLDFRHELLRSARVIFRRGGVGVEGATGQE